MQLQVVSKEQFPLTAADLIEPYFTQDAQDGQRQICFAAGNTPTTTYAELVRRFQAGRLPVDLVVGFTLDEYTGLSRTHPRSCFQSLQRQLYQGLQWSSEQTMTYDDTPEPEASAMAYEQLIAKSGGFDLAILGIGMNGHVGFNEPGTPFDSRTHVATLTAMTTQRAHREGWMDVPSYGLTVGIGTLKDAKTVLLMANGSHKADIVLRIVRGEVSEEVPATAFRDHPNSLLLLDEDAASQL